MTTRNNTTYTTAQMEETMRKQAKAFQDGFDQFSRMTRDQMEKAFPNVMQAYEEGSANMRDNLDACAKATALALKGFEQIVNACMGFSQEIVDNNVSAAKGIMNCRNVQEMVTLQSDMARTNMDRLMSQSSKISEMAMKAANEASQPLQKRANQTMDTFARKAKKAA